MSSRPALLRKRSAAIKINRQQQKAPARPEDAMAGPFFVAFAAFLVYLYLHYSPIRDPRVELHTWFGEQGGWMSPHLSLVPSVKYHGNELVAKNNSNAAESIMIEHLDTILEIPTKLLFTMEKAKRTISTPKAEESIKRLISNPLDQQDVWIALDLMLECSKGNTSNWYPYMKLLPTSVPRLATFTWPELDLLQDDDLSSFAKAQAQFFKLAWNNGAGAALLRVATKEEEGSDCLTLDAYTHYVSVSASRAMILDEVKYLTPMADMINHADRNSTVAGSSNFQSYHELQGDKLVVRADRNFAAGASIFEEYGKLDNSLYVTAFGFVPKDNPYHCVMLPIPGNTDGSNHGEATVCVRRDGSIEHPQEESMFILAVLSPDCSTKEDCLAHPEREERVKAYIQKAAATKLLDASSKTTLEQDAALLTELKELEEGEETWNGMKKDRVRVAIDFRMEEKQMLAQLSKGDFKE
jgi:hypothetical protein